jgi:hypothetical protein
VYDSKYKNQKTISINLENLSNGSYILIAKTNNKIISKKIIKTE